MECLIKENKTKLHLKDGDIVSHLKRKWNYCLSLMNCFTWHLWRCLQESPRLSLMLCWFAPWEMFWPEALYFGSAWWQPGKPSWEGAVWAVYKAETVPLLCKVSLLKRSGNSCHLETNGSEDHAALIMAFLKTARKMAEIEAVRRKRVEGTRRPQSWCQNWDAPLKGHWQWCTCTSEQQGIQKKAWCLLVKGLRSQVLVFSNLRWIYL